MAGERRPTGALRRGLRHLWIGPLHVRRAFPPAAMLRIERAIAEGELRHTAELRFCIESSLDASRLWRGASPRDRAIEVFSRFGLWDTEANNGVLVYLLWADHAVEIVADRGAARRVEPATWRRACDGLVRACREGRPVDGAIACIEVVSGALEQAYPATGRPDRDELPNRPLVL